VVLGDEGQIERMLTNLVDNALRYARSTVEVRLTVEDDGPGVARADRERVWDRFVRLDDDRSRPGGGSVFVVRLPLRGSRPSAAGQRQRGYVHHGAASGQ
jgi:signal transduction histidine kinase